MKEAAETIASSRTAMQLRYLQTLNIIAAERGSTIMFPIPIDILGGMQGGLGAVSLSSFLPPSLPLSVSLPSVPLSSFSMHYYTTVPVPYSPL